MNKFLKILKALSIFIPILVKGIYELVCEVVDAYNENNDILAKQLEEIEKEQEQNGK